MLDGSGSNFLTGAQAKFTTSTGLIGGSSYLYIAYTG